jgi:hypothetical protein
LPLLLLQLLLLLCLQLFLVLLLLLLLLLLTPLSPRLAIRQGTAPLTGRHAVN